MKLTLTLTLCNQLFDSYLTLWTLLGVQGLLKVMLSLQKVVWKCHHIFFFFFFVEFNIALLFQRMCWFTQVLQGAHTQFRSTVLKDLKVINLSPHTGHVILRPERIMLTQGTVGLPLMCVHRSGSIVPLLLWYLSEPCCWISSWLSRTVLWPYKTCSQASKQQGSGAYSQH